jgi:hypothetical protein
METYKKGEVAEWHPFHSPTRVPDPAGTKRKGNRRGGCVTRPAQISLRRGGRVAEGSGLLNRRMVLNCTGGSNPPLSAKPENSLFGF